MDELVSDRKRSIPWKIYFAHTLSTWGDNMWWFAGGLYMIQLAPGSLRLTALYGLIIAASVICFGASIGNWIDKTERLIAARTFLAIQNICVSICALGISCFLWGYRGSVAQLEMNEDITTISRNLSHHEEYLVLRNENNATNELTSLFPHLPSFETSRLITIIGVITFSSVARLASSGTVIILQKDWIVVIADNDTDYLARMNSILRTIELTTYMLAPIISGQLFSFIGYIWTGVFIAVWNVLSVVFEYMLLNGIYKQYPSLAQKMTSEKKTNDIDPETYGGQNDTLTGKNLVHQQEQSHGKSTNGSISLYGRMILDTVQESFQGWRTYFVHPVRNAGLALALLYMTVLGFDNITYGYAIIQNVPESILGILVAISAVVGVCGSVAYPIIRRHLGLERTGLLGMFLLVSTSLLCIASIFLPGSPFANELFATSDYDSNIEQGRTSNVLHMAALMTGIILARFGLWIVDLTITQILQERVEEERRGIINGVQDSLNNFLDLLKCILVILLPRPSDFGYLILLSYASISSGWLLYAAFSRQQRGHLFHFCRLIPHSNQLDSDEHSHWPFLPEGGTEKLGGNREEMKPLQTLQQGGASESFESNMDNKTQQEISSMRLETIIDCERELDNNLNP